MLAMILFYCIPEAQFEGGRLLMCSARQGHAASLHAASILSFNGSGMGQQHKDVKMGVALCARAAALGHSEAMRELGHCLLDGYGVRQDVQAGWRMFLEAQAAELAPRSSHLQDLSSLVAAARKRKSDENIRGSKRLRVDGSLGSTQAINPAAQDVALLSFLGAEKRVEPSQQPRDAVQQVFRFKASNSCPSRVVFKKANGFKSKCPAYSTFPKQLKQEQWKPQQLEQKDQLATKTSVILKLLSAVKSGSFSLSPPNIAALQPVLTGAQTSLLSADVHPAYSFIKEWFSTRPVVKTESEFSGCTTNKNGASVILAASGAAATGVCSRQTCGRPEKRPLEFSRCSMCWSARYCSRSCQLHDWKERHGGVCSAVPVSPSAQHVVAATVQIRTGHV